MSAAAPAPMPDAPVDPLWQRIASSPIGPETTALTFAAKLARDNGWSAGYAARVLEEYRRFCWLGMTTGHEVTPSDPVDQCWHLHLTYSRDYWERFCPDVLGRPFHHGPTTGGPGELSRHFVQYAETLRSYQAAFGAPPADIWPDARATLLGAMDARRVNLGDVILLPKGAIRWTGQTLLVLLAVAGAAFAAWMWL